MKIEISIETVINGQKKQKIISLDLTENGLTVGRTAKDLRINDTKISSQHLFVFSNKEIGVGVIDLASRNGTFLDGHKIERAIIKIGSRIRIGSTILSLLKIENPMEDKESSKNPSSDEVVNAWPNLWLAVP